MLRQLTEEEFTRRAANAGPVAVPGTPVPLPMGDAASRFFRVKVMIDLP